MKKFIFKYGGYMIVAVILSAAIAFVPDIAGTRPFWDENKELLIGLIIGMVPSFILLYTQNRKEERERQNWYLERREPIFDDLVSGFTNMMLASKHADGSPEKAQAEKKFLDAVLAAKSKLILWAPAYVLRAVEDMEAMSLAKDRSPLEVVKYIDKLFRAIRKALELDDPSLEDGELIGVLMTPDAREELNLKSRIKK